MSNANSVKSLKYNKPTLFSPAVVRNIIDDANGVSTFYQTTLSTVSGTALDASGSMTGSFKYDLLMNGIRSTQQLNISWSQFENHTFFNSAQVKTQVAFDTIINYFPFDGTQKEIEIFFGGLTGFENYIYQLFPKYKGYLFFSGTNGESSGGTYVAVKDVAGADFPALSRNQTGMSILDPVLKSMTIEMQLYLPPISSSDQIILQKISGSGIGNEYGFYLSTAATCSITSASLIMAFISGTSILTTSGVVGKGQFNHIAFTWDRTPSVNQVSMYLNEGFVNSSSQVEFAAGFGFGSALLTIGSGSKVSLTNFTPTNTLSGAIDELRIWHLVRNPQQMAEFAQKNVFGDDGYNLKLYYKFNEPSGSNSNLVIDSSGNSLHGVLSTFAYVSGIRDLPTGSIAGPDPMVNENLTLDPILFPDHPLLDTLKTTYLEQASQYDLNNPNIITNLIPNHYLLDGQLQDALSSELGNIISQSLDQGLPQTNQLGDTQLLLSLLWTWAKFFDEMKLFIQAFGDLYHVDYTSYDIIPDSFLQMMADQYGITLPPLFNGSSLPQFLDAQNLNNQYNIGSYTLQYLQNQIWRRILINIRDTITSKGTIHSIKSFVRSIGIDPDKNFRIREYGGPTIKSLQESRESRKEISGLLNFVSGGYIRSPYLSSSRIEAGAPATANPSLFGPNDGLYTSGSWTFEAYYSMPLTNSLKSTSQSLSRMSTTGSNPEFNSNLVLTADGNLNWFFNACGPTDIILTTSIAGTSSLNIFDTYPYYISYGVQRNDEISSSISSSFFLRAAKTDYQGNIITSFSTSMYGIYPDFQKISSSFNASGVFIEIGNNNSNIQSISKLKTTSSIAFVENFEGKVGRVRFWTKALSENEWREHARNVNSVGVDDPLTHFNFATHVSDSWERLRFDVTADQPVTGTDSSGNILLFDFSQNNLSWSGSLFPTSSLVITPQLFYYSYISPKFDEASTTNKIRPRSFLNFQNIIDSTNQTFVGIAPVYEIPQSETPIDNTKFSIDFSIADALNQDIINIFSVLDTMDNLIGDPSLMFSADYPKLDELRHVYFNRLTDKINIKGFFEFFKWFDSNFSSTIMSLVPRKTKFLGTNFVVESHMLERGKYEYLSADVYIGEDSRNSGTETILLQQFEASMQKY